MQVGGWGGPAKPFVIALRVASQVWGLFFFYIWCYSCDVKIDKGTFSLLAQRRFEEEQEEGMECGAFLHVAFVER